ncbi:phospholipid scramblase family protein [Scenedesmus sp. PABB004]|nr:phospholipid scramblase family protein [Scenedesmus sp. PABB004]
MSSAAAARARALAALARAAQRCCPAPPAPAGLAALWAGAGTAAPPPWASAPPPWASAPGWRAYADDAARRRLAAAQARRQREADAAAARAAAARAAAAAPPPPDAASSAPPPAAPGPGTALAPSDAPPSAAAVRAVVGHDALVVTRAVEWGTMLLGFEQATKYTVYDQEGGVVALIAEEGGGLGTEVARQLLRTRRSFTSTVLSADGSQVVLRVRRPAYLISSTMYIEDPQGGVVGEVRQRWHPWRRLYDLYLGRTQFAAIAGGLWAWEFELKGADGATLALIDRNFQGFAKELFTDAGKYVVHFGMAPPDAAAAASRTLEARSGTAGVAVTPLAQARTDVAVIPTVTGSQLVVPRPLPLSERLVCLAAAISIDYDFFSQHSAHSGFFGPPLFMPVPLPGGGVGGAAGAAGEAAGGAGGAAAGGAVAGEAAGGAGAGPGLDVAPPPPPPPGGGLDGGADAGVSGFGAAGQQPAFGDEAESFRWDDGGGAAGGGGGGEEGGWGGMFGGGSESGGGGDEGGPSGLWGVLVGIWAMLFGE